MLVGVVSNAIQGNWGGLVVSLLAGSLMVIATTMWQCQICGNRQDHGTAIVVMLFVASLICVISAIATGAQISKFFDCGRFREEPSEDMLEDFQERHDKSMGWEEWADHETQVCELSRMVTYVAVGVNLAIAGLLASTATWTRLQLAQWKAAGQ
jgi:hypothetical protein